MAQHHAYLIDQLMRALPADQWRVRCIKRYVDERTNARGRRIDCRVQTHCSLDQTYTPRELLNGLVRNDHPQGTKSHRSVLAMITNHSYNGYEVLMHPTGAITHVLLDLDDVPLDETLNLMAGDRV